MAHTVLKTLTQAGFLANVDQQARHLWHELLELCRTYPQIFSSVQGAGLMLALTCTENNMIVAEKLLHLGLLVIPAGGNTIRLLPPLIIDETHITQALSILQTYAKGNA